MSNEFDFSGLEFSKKQLALIEYLLLRLGFRHGAYSDQYVRKLLRMAHLHKNTRALRIGVDWIFDNKPDYHFRCGDKYLPRKYNIIDYLIDEYKIKKNKSYVLNNSVPEYISATDLANFTYCSIGYSLSKSFNIPPLISAERGSKMHEEAWLLRIKNFLEGKELDKEFFGPDEQEDFRHREPEDITSLLTPENRIFFDDIKNSTPIYTGHSRDGDTEKYFKNETLNFFGQPDYVFKNRAGEIFIVEEKFKTAYSAGIDPIFSNHKVQLASYIYYLDELKASYGYLVYWVKLREIEEEGYVAESRNCIIKKITKSDIVKEFLDNAYNGLVSFKEKKFLNFNPEKLSPIRCASCVFSMYCGHKNGRRNQVTLPYQRGYHNLYPAKYPDTLKTDEKTDLESLNTE